MSSSLDSHVARLAVERGWVADRQLQEALAIQVRGLAGALEPPPEPFGAALDGLRGRPLLEILRALGHLDSQRAGELESAAVVASAAAPSAGAGARATMMDAGFGPGQLARAATPGAAVDPKATFVQPGFVPPSPAQGTFYDPGFRPASAAPPGAEPGHAAGVLQGKREALLRVLRAKFGTIPASVEVRLQAVQDGAQLDALLDRFVLARTIADVGL